MASTLMTLIAFHGGAKECAAIEDLPRLWRVLTDGAE
jgi:hypothetical protein